MALASAVVFAAAVPSLEADARERQGRGEVKTERGVFKGQGSVHRQDGVRTRTGTITGPHGGQTTVSDTRQIDKAAGTASHDRTRVFKDGSTRTVDADHVKTGAGAWSSTRTVTGRDGDSRTQSADTTITKTDDGRSISSVIETEKRGTILVDRDVSKGDGARQVSSTATFEDGSTRTHARETACAPGEACTRTDVYTGRDGQTVSSVASRTRTEDGFERDRATTFPDGSTRSVAVEGASSEEGRSFTRTVTGRDGETRTQTGEIVITK